MKTLDEKRLEYFKSRLLEERSKTIELIENMDSKEKAAEKNIDSQLSTHSNHPADKGTEVYMRSQDQGIKRNLQEKLDEIDKSLEDMKKGTYGYCENCDKQISEERLEIMPYAKTCLGCSDEPTEMEIGTEYESMEEKNLGKDTDTVEDVMEDNIVKDDPSHSTGDNIGIKDESDDLKI